MNQNTSIGEKIKALRTSQNLTLKQLGEMTNLSTGFLSQMERGLSSIAIDTLETIAGVLGVSLGSFFSEEPHADCSDPVVHSFSMPTTPVGPQIIQNTLSHDVAAFDFLPFFLSPTRRRKTWRCTAIPGKNSSIYWKVLRRSSWSRFSIRSIRATVSRFILMKGITG